VCFKDVRRSVARKLRLAQLRPERQLIHLPQKCRMLSKTTVSQFVRSSSTWYFSKRQQDKDSKSHRGTTGRSALKPYGILRIGDWMRRRLA